MIKYFKLMKSHKIYLVLFIGIIIGYLIGVNTDHEIDQNIPIIPGWHTTIDSSQFSLNALLLILTVIVLGMLAGRVLPFYRNYFTMERIEVINIGLATVGIACIISALWELFIIWYSGYMFEQFAFNSRSNLWVETFVMAISVVITQAFWVKRIRQNPIWTAIISLFIIIAGLI